jgi:hypothetical protein
VSDGRTVNAPPALREASPKGLPAGRVPFRVEGQTDTPIKHIHLGEVATQPLSRLPLATLGYASPKGEKPVPAETEPTFGNSTTPSHRKGLVTMPSPLGEGQTDMPINHAHLGEVALHPQPRFCRIN